MEEKKTVTPMKQTITLDNREKLCVTGVVDVESFNEESIIAVTDLGVLIIRGTELHINKLNLDSNELVVDGDIFSLEYSDGETGKSKSFFGKMFK
ncbi:sporulation protein YabP [Ruminiclostridium papyrosolvens DSM 2782]|uniref:Sporulation protein YabP n=1 Tax=Ruminiclostridium papyrosolvens DSM 2782 TaxID=588581 RepID=F1TBK0_9FIRM|nr:sporulation protein YabP [Ruminiclostridium papyrosolvens]EGD48404.1 sporulation protein YabP [Ruminiclostridium papyrosolvens DSM 2782]WES34092.1 sporulation protein YabP [Ruminiclostridium papyrosolvens DSM 2782]